MAKFISEEYRDFDWVIRVIKSCTTDIQLINTTKLIKAFNRKWNNPKLYHELIKIKLDHL